MSIEGWKEVELAEVIEFNPKENLRKGMPAKKVSMADLEPFTRKIRGYSRDKYTSGSKFRNGDTLMARITPCLENGKTAYVDILQGDEVAFGSTEFIVLRGREGKADPQFVYYLAISPRFRDLAIQSMTGSTGRQRAQVDALEKARFPIPPLEEQRKAASILSALDEKIELNHRISGNLEEMAQAIFQSWFVNFEPFRDGEFVDSELGPIPKGWKVGNFQSLLADLSGGDWGKGSPRGNHQARVYCIRGADLPEVARGNQGNIPVRYILEKNRRKKALRDGDIVIEISGGSPTQSTGRAALIHKVWMDQFDSELICTNFCRVMRMKKSHYSAFAYMYLRDLYDKEVFFQYENGTTGIKNLDIQGFLQNCKIIVPPDGVLEEFNDEVQDLLHLIQQLGRENETLTTLRDTLLPKLISGEIRVSSD